jgi:hypothetical protein
MAGLHSDRTDGAGSRSLLLGALIVAFAMASASVAWLTAYQDAGADFSCFWAGGKAALSAPGRLYDFGYITGLQGWPFGPTSLRPYIYPPSALLVFVPFALAPYWVGYGLWVLMTGALFLWAGLRAGAPWWLILLPAVALVVYCGQVTFLVGGLVLAGLALRDRRILSGLLFGAAAAVKPQLVILLPVALIAEARWPTFFVTGLTGAALCGVSAMIWGLQPWMDWLPALARFQRVIFDNPDLVADAITPYAALTSVGLNGAWAFLLAPAAGWLVWATFRRTPYAPDRLIAVVGGALLVSPYAMNYELALFAPAVATYLARTNDRRWPIYALASVIYVAAQPIGAVSLVAVLALPLARSMNRDRREAAQASADLSTASTASP